MKILEAFGEPIADGGQESFVFGVIDKMDMAHFHIDCLTAYDCRNERYRSIIEEKGGKIYSLNLPFAPGKSRRNIRKPFASFLNEHKYDIVHIHSGSISVLSIMAEVADKLGVEKVIVHSHCTGEIDNLKHKFLRYLASLSMRKHVDLYCACSKAAAEWKFESRYARNALIIKNGIDIEKFSFSAKRRDEWRLKLGYSDNCVVLGHVGRFCYQKNQSFLIELMTKLNNTDLDYRLLLVGDGEDRNILENLIKERNLEGKVILAGSVHNVEDYLQAMDIFLFPSLFEGLGIVVIEAQAAGLPVITSDAVPEDALCSDVMSRIPLDIKMWTEKIEKMQKYYRENNDDHLIRNGYDIGETSRVVGALYGASE